MPLIGLAAVQDYMFLFKELFVFIKLLTLPKYIVQQPRDLIN